MKLTCRKREGRWVIRRANTTICKISTYPHALRIMRAIIGATP